MTTTKELIVWLDVSINTEHPHMINGLGAKETLIRIRSRLEAAEKMVEALKHIANGCLVPPDGGSPNLNDAIETAQQALAKWEGLR